MSYKIKTYPDGASYADIDTNQIHFDFRINSYEDLWHLNQIVDAYRNNGIRPQITIPNLIDAQADRRFGENQSSGLKLVCKFLNSMEADFTIFHPHNAEVVEALIDDVKIMGNIGYIMRVLSEQFNNGNGIYGNYQSNLVLMSSDAGGFKPLINLCNQINWRGETSSASKSRSYENGKSELTQLIGKSDFQGKDILIVDDICVYGGTFKGLAKQLRTHNCGKLYLAVSHMTMQDLGEDPVTSYFDKVFTTNSKFDSYDYTGNPFRGIKNLEVVKLFKDV